MDTWVNWLTSILSLIIGIVSTYLVQSSILAKTRKHQLEDKNIERIWLLEDKTTDITQRIMFNRVDLIETIAKENFYKLREIMSQVADFRNKQLDAQSVSNNIASIQNNLQYQNAMAQVVEDKELNSRLFEFEGKYAEFTKTINDELAGKRTDRLGDHYSSLQIPFENIITRLDQIRLIIVRRK